MCGLAILEPGRPGACTQPSHVADAGIAPPPLEIVLPRATLPDGATLDLELATTPEETTTGLMFRPSLPGDRGMLLLWSEERNATIWMMNVLVPLDIVFLDDVGKVIQIVGRRATVCRRTLPPIHSRRSLARAVLEMAAGSVAAHGHHRRWEHLEFERVPGYPARIRIAPWVEFAKTDWMGIVHFGLSEFMTAGVG